ncbi:MAG: sigma-70 family RNA polymerase sigma factor [Acidobacteriota bacterium]
MKAYWTGNKVAKNGMTMSITSEGYDSDRKLLWGICYRMTGNVMDADDIVQETFLKALEKFSGQTDEQRRAWLIKVAMNLSRDCLRRRRQRGYVGPWLPSPLPDDILDSLSYESEQLTTAQEDSPVARYELQESVSFAFLLALEALTPIQRATLLLRDVFDYSTNETAEILGSSVASIKIALHRARKAMLNYDKTSTRSNLALAEMTRLALERFLYCLRTGDSAGLAQLLVEDVVVVSDGGGEVMALLAPMRGREKVLRLVERLNAVYHPQTEARFCLLNNLPALLFQREEVRAGHGQRFSMHCQVGNDGTIQALYFIFAPSKLAALK